MIDIEKLGRKIREERKKLFLKQGDLSGGEFSKGYISLIEKGKINPSLKSLSFIADKLNKPIVYFLDDDFKEKGQLQEEISLYKNVLNLIICGRKALDCGNYEEAILNYNEILKNKIDDYSYNIINFYLARTYILINDYKKSIEILKLCLPYFIEHSIPEILVEIYYYMGLCYGNLHDFSNSLSNYIKAAEEFKKSDMRNYELKCKILFSIANLYNKLGKYIKSRDYYVKCLDYATQTKTVDYIAKCNNGLGFVSYKLKEYKDALKYIRSALIISKALDLKDDIANEYTYMGLVYTDLKKYNLAEKYFYYSYLIYKELKDETGIAYNLTELGRIQFLRGDYKNALHYLDSSFKIATDINKKDEIGRIYTILGYVHLKLNEFNKAKEELQESVKILSKLGLKKDLSDAYKALGNLYLVLSDIDKAKEYFNKSIEILCDI